MFRVKEVHLIERIRKVSAAQFRAEFRWYRGFRPKSEGRFYFLRKGYRLCITKYLPSLTLYLESSR